jgi:lipopolysaccharide export system permease protein
MSIISKYLTREILKIFGIVLITVIGIYIAVDFFEKADNFVAAELPFSKIIFFFLCNMPFILAQIIPVAILLSVLIVFGLMKKNNEIIALKSSGVSALYLLKPVLAIGVLASIFLFIFLDTIVPVTLEKANKIWLIEVKQKRIVRSKEKNIWIKGKHRITHIKFYRPKSRSIYGITINHFDDDFHLTKRTDAPKGVFKNGKWYLYDLMEQSLDFSSGETSTKFEKYREEALGFLPEDFQEVIKKPEEMRLKELYEYIKEIESEGYGATSYRVDLFAKTAFPAVCFLLCLTGTGIALTEKSREGLAVGITFGIGTAFLYWIFYSFCLSLGYGEMLPPWVAAWSTNAIFFLIGTLMIVHAK